MLIIAYGAHSGYSSKIFLLTEPEDDETSYKDMIDKDKRKWDAADLDKDGKLSKEEFSAFIHPEETEHMKDIVVLVS